MGFCTSTIKFVLFVFNILCALVGLAVLGIALWIYLISSNLRNVLHGELSGILITMMVLGGVTLIIACLGCFGAVKEDPCYVTTYAVLLIIILLAQLAVAGVALYFFKAMHFEQQWLKNLEDNFGNYDKHKDTVDIIQQSLQCCGFDGPSSSQGELPASCCSNPSAVGQSCPRSQAFSKDCRGPALMEIKHSFKVVIITLFAIVGVELLCIICAFLVANSIRKQMRAGYTY